MTSLVKDFTKRSFKSWVEKHEFPYSRAGNTLQPYSDRSSETVLLRRTESEITISIVGSIPKNAIQKSDFRREGVLVRRHADGNIYDEWKSSDYPPNAKIGCDKIIFGQLHTVSEEGGGVGSEAVPELIVHSDGTTERKPTPFERELLNMTQVQRRY